MKDFLQFLMFVFITGLIVSYIVYLSDSYSKNNYKVMTECFEKVGDAKWCYEKLPR